MEMNEIEVRDMNELAASLNLAKEVITKEYLYKLSEYEVAEIPEELKALDISDYTRIYKFTKMVSDKKESVIDKLVTVINAAYSSNATVVTLIEGHPDSTDYYLGVINKEINQDNYNIQTQGETFRGVLTGNFPGVEIEQVKGESKRLLLKNVFTYNYITAISGIASVRNEKNTTYEKFVQGIEHLVDSLEGREYSVVVLADPVSTEEIEAAKLGYETLYTQLSPFLKMSVSFNESETVTLTQSQTKGITESIGESTSMTQNYSETSGWSAGTSKSTSTNKNKGQLVGAIAGAGVGTAAGIAAAIATAGTATVAVPKAAFVGSQLGSQIGGQLGGALIGSEGKSKGETFAQNKSATKSSGITTSNNSSRAEQKSDTESEAEGKSHGRTMQISNENKTVKNLLGKIDKNIERLEKCEAYGAFNCAAYVISSDPETNAIVSSSYNALMRGDSSALQASHINNWNANEYQGQKVKEYLSKYSHPLFRSPQNNILLFSPAVLTNAYELSVNIGFPKKSISGLPVYETTSFGRNVFETNTSKKNEAKIELGKIYHMGAKQDVDVQLNLKSLAMHTFVTGSTGSGKSNTVYQMLRELEKQNVRYLVVEPAKGEYKHVFGNKHANVYGTNPYISPLLKINPFKFPKGIHVLEHIDRLIEIFNVCWPMYAAMPAVLKDSVERAYIDAGWDLETSKNKYSEDLFPTFSDVLSELTKVINESSFSQEVKDNYIGSLATRVKSLTNGIYGRIFDNRELGDKKLFDENVIVDLSRVGSVETKSMIMGILVMRLQEYRMISGDMNTDLKHVTILEEAHNLLKKTSTEQSSESSNLLGKSVEMLSNAIAEVRTYGEGFIIADQAPGLLDRSVIRNTNTKIIMRLPDEEDRKLVGKAANLSEEQIKELAKLPTGVAAVYQNNWLEPVLCQVYYEKCEGVYESKVSEETFDDESTKKMILRLLDKVAGERLDLNMEELREEVVKAVLPTELKTRMIKLFQQNGTVELKDISSVMYDLIVTPKMEKEASEAESIDEWKNAFLYSENSKVADLDEANQNQIIECILRAEIERYDKPDEYLETWYRYKRGEVL